LSLSVPSSALVVMVAVVSLLLVSLSFSFVSSTTLSFSCFVSAVLLLSSRFNSYSWPQLIPGNPPKTRYLLPPPLPPPFAAAVGGMGRYRTRKFATPQRCPHRKCQRQHRRLLQSDRPTTRGGGPCCDLRILVLHLWFDIHLQRTLPLVVVLDRV